MLKFRNWAHGELGTAIATVYTMDENGNTTTLGYEVYVPGAGTSVCLGMFNTLPAAIDILNRYLSKVSEAITEIAAGFQSAQHEESDDGWNFEM